MKTLLLNKDEVSKLIDMQMVIDAVEKGYVAFNQKKAIQPNIMSIEIPKNNGELDIKACYLESTDKISVKAASGFWDNRKKYNINNSLSTVIIFDGKTGAPKCIMDGSLITGYRTGAAGAISSKYLAKNNSKIIAIIGCGNQAKMQVKALKEILDFKKINVWSISPKDMQDYKTDVEEMLGVSVNVCDTAKNAVNNADIIISTTPSKEPIVKKDWLKKGVHIVAVGADMEGKQELDENIFADAKIVNDNIAECIHRGETQNPINKSIIKKSDIYSEIGEIIAGEKIGRENDSEITIFDTTGMAVQDNVTAIAIYEAAIKQNIGTYYEFFK